MSTQTLPKVLATSVVRSTQQGQSHGGVYLVDLATNECNQVIDWNDGSIDWEGRGGERGLRGIAFYHDNIYLASSQQILIYDKTFKQLGSIRHEYLKWCHEICISNDLLYVTSTGFDAVLVYDLKAEQFILGHSLRYTRFQQWLRSKGFNPTPQYRKFDPAKSGVHTPGDSTHLNNVHFENDILFASGGKMTHLMQITPRCKSYAVLPKITHNARPYKGGVLLNYTGKEYVCTMDREGQVQQHAVVPSYDANELTNTHLPQDHARQAFGRGMALIDDNTLVGGSSPATLSVYKMSDWQLQKQVNLTKDVRNAIHGLEVWPFDQAA